MTNDLECSNFSNLGAPPLQVKKEVGCEALSSFRRGGIFEHLQLNMPMIVTRADKGNRSRQQRDTNKDSAPYAEQNFDFSVFTPLL